MKNDQGEKLKQEASTSRPVEGDEPCGEVQLPAVLPEQPANPDPIEPPEKGTRASEATRSVVDAGLSAVPFVGGALSGLGRSALPSKRDKKTAEWRSDVSEAVNRNSSDIAAQKRQTAALEFEHVKLRQTVGSTIERIDQLSSKDSNGIAETEPLDGEFAAYRKLIDQEKFQTVLTMLHARFDDVETDKPLSSTTAARAMSLKAICMKGLGQDKEAAELFIEASKLDPDNPKHRSNLVVAFLILKKPDEAEACVRALIADEPGNVMHWANRIYVGGAKGVPLGIDEIPSELQRTKDVCVAQVVTIRSHEDPSWPEVARSALALHPNSKTLQRAVAEADLEDAVEVVMRDDADPATVSASIGIACRAADALLSLWSEHTLTEAFAASPDVTLLQNALMGLRVCERMSEAKALVQVHVEILLKDETARIALAAFAIDADDQDLLDRTLEERFPGDAPARLERALRTEDWAQALEIVELNTEELNGHTRIDVNEMAGILRASLEPETERPDALSEVLAELTPDPHTYLVVSRISARFGEDAIAYEAFERALAEVSENDRDVRFRLASECMNRERPETAIELLQGHVDPQVQCRERQILGLAYASTAVPVASGVDFFESVQRVNNGDEELQRAGGHFHLNRRRPSDAIPWFRRALNMQPNKARTQLALWQALARSGQTRQADKLLASVDLGQIDGEPRDQMNVAQLLWRGGRRDALDHAFEIAVRNEDDLGVCQSYIGLILGDAFGSEAPPMPESEIVETGSYVRLSRREGDPFEFVVVDEPDDVALHLARCHPIVSAALERKVGDEFETTTGPNQFQWRVEEIKSKYLHLFHRLSRSIQDRFPESASLWSVTIKDDDFTPILESVRARRAQVERVETLYRENPMPLAAVASAGGGNAIDFALHLAQSGQEVISATGRTPDTTVEAANTHRAIGQGAVVDTYTGWLLSKLSLLKKVREVYGSILVPASIVDEIAAMVDDLGGYEDGRLTATSEDDRLATVQHTAEEVKSQIKDLQAVGADLQEHGKVVGIEVSAEMDAELLRLSEFLGTQFDALSVAHRERVRILSADLRMRQVANGVFNTEAFGMDALLDNLVEQKVLSEAERAEALLTLAALRHSYIGLNAPTLVRMMDIDDTEGMVRFQRAAGYFGMPDADIASHVTTAAAFSSIAFGLEHPRPKAEKATGLILRSLVRFRGVPLKVIVNSFVRLANDPEITNYVASWLRGHFLMDLYERQMNDDASKSDGS